MKHKNKDSLERSINDEIKGRLDWS